MIGEAGSRASCPVSHSARSRWLLAAAEERWISIQNSSSVTSASYRFRAGRPQSASTPLRLGCRADAGRHRTGWDVSQPGQELVQGGLSIDDRGAFIVGEGDAGEHSLQVVLGLQQQRLQGVLGGIHVESEAASSGP